MVRDKRHFLLLIPAVAVLALLLWGMGRVLLFSFAPQGTPTLQLYIDFFRRSDYVDTLLRTVVVSGLTTIICTIIAYPTAYFIARRSKHRDLVMLLIILPWLVSLIVRTFGWIVLLGNRGVINGMLMAIGITSTPLGLMFNTTGVIVGLVHVFCPFMVLSILAVFLQLDDSVEEAAMSLRAGPFTTFRRVVLPLTLPGVVSGAIIIFLMSTGAVVTPLMLGGMRDPLLSTQIYREVIDMFNFPKASAIAVVLTVTSFAVIIPLQWVERRVSRHLKLEATR